MDTPAPAPTQPLKILIVDDNVDGADTLAELLRLVGHEVRTAYDGNEAMRLGEVFEPQVVVMDISMPRPNGLETARRMRQTSWGSRVRLLALSGWSDTSDRKEAVAAGFDGHLPKSVKFEKLLAELVVQMSVLSHGV